MTRATKLVVAISILAIAVRLVWIDQPFIDHWSWRQSDVAAIARNFLHNGFRLAWPQIDWAGNQPGYVGTEFPILPFVAAVCYKIFGVHEWIGRSQAVIFFALSLPFFFLIVREIFGGQAATWSLFFYSFAPLNVMASRCFMPDVPSLSLAIIGLYFFLRWTQNGKSRSLFASAGLISLSVLIKVTSIITLVPLLSIAGIGVKSTVQRPRLQFLFIAIAILPAAAWYWHALQISHRFYPYHFFGAGGIQIENLGWYARIARVTLFSSLTPILAILALLGLFVRPRVPFGRLFHWWLGAMIVFVVIAGYGNRHPWYQLPLVPISAALGGAGCTAIAAKIANARANVALSILLAGGLGILSLIQVRELYEPAGAQFRDAGLALSRITSPDALVIAADNGEPTILYYAQRNGWHFPEQNGLWWGDPRDSRQLIANLEQLRRRGATYLVLTTNNFWWSDYLPEFGQHVTASAELIEAASDFKIYKLAKLAPSSTE